MKTSLTRLARWSTLQAALLPARVAGFHADMLDMLAATGQVVWIGRGALGSKDGRIALYLREHVRVPLDLFTVQTQMLLQYHMRDPVVFYNKEDQWDIPIQSSFGRSQPLRPYYIVARLPGEIGEEFLLIQPFTPDNRHNLVGWMAARNDGEHYGERILFNFPTGRHVDGPNQIEARIDALAVEVHRQGHDIHVAGALTVAEQRALDPVGPRHQSELGRRHARAGPARPAGRRSRPVPRPHHLAPDRRRGTASSPPGRNDRGGAGVVA